MPATSGTPISETQFTQLLAALNEASRVAAGQAAQAAAVQQETAEQARISEAARLRGMDTQQLGHEVARRLSEAYGQNAPAWLAATRARGGRTFLDAAVAETSVGGVTESALAALNDPKALAQASSGELSAQIAARVRAAYGMRSPGWSR